MRQVAVVTGGSRGIGLETCGYLASRGWNIALCSRDGDDAETAAELIRRTHGVDAIGTPADVSSPDDMDDFAARVRRELGQVRALVCNAAVLGPVGRLEQIRSADLLDTFAVNVLGFSNACRSFWSDLRSVGDFRIVALAGGGLGGPGQMTRAPGYVPSKSALVSMVEVINDEVVEAGGTVNVVAPGNIPTGFMRSVLDAGPAAAGDVLYSQAADREGKQIGDSLGRFLDLLEFLLGEDARFISGRFLSARWNDPASLMTRTDEGLSDAMFRLRRIDDDLFKESRG